MRRTPSIDALIPAAALREIGRIERILFILEWLQSPDLRHRVQVGLNKGEATTRQIRARTPLKLYMINRWPRGMRRDVAQPAAAGLTNTR
jgi:hypothetical protein